MAPTLTDEQRAYAELAYVKLKFINEEAADWIKSYVLEWSYGGGCLRPETEAENDMAHIRRRLQEAGLKP